MEKKRKEDFLNFLSICCCHLVTQFYPALCDPVACSTPSLPVPLNLLKFAQVHAHCIGEAIQPSHALTPSSAFNIGFHWFDLLAVQGTLRSLFQHHSSKASILWCSVFFMVQLLQLYVITGKITALTMWTFVSRVMSLLFKHCLGLS